MVDIFSIKLDGFDPVEFLEVLHDMSIFRDSTGRPVAGLPALKVHHGSCEFIIWDEGSQITVKFIDYSAPRSERTIYHYLVEKPPPDTITIFKSIRDYKVPEIVKAKKVECCYINEPVIAMIRTTFLKETVKDIQEAVFKIVWRVYRNEIYNKSKNQTMRVTDFVDGVLKPMYLCQGKS